MLSFQPYERHEVLVRWEDGSPDSKALLRRCPFPGCHHRRHSNLALCFHKSCYHLFNEYSYLLSGRMSAVTMREIWLLGKSRLWLSAPKSKEAEKLSVSRTTSSSCLDLPYRKSMNPLTFELYRLFARLPNELKHSIVSQTHGCFFYAPWTILNEYYQLGPMLNQLGNDDSEAVSLNSSVDIYLSRAMLDRRSYIISISNRPILRSLFITRPTEIYRILLVSDNRGVVDIECLDQSTDISASSTQSSLWYRMIAPRQKKAISQLRTIRDVSGSN